MPTRQAYELAQERSYDLVEVNPTAKPTVCRFMDYGKYKYEQAKSDRGSKAKHKPQVVSEVKLKPKVEEHDFQVKANTVLRLLNEGNRVKVSLRFKGREVVHTDLAIKLFERLYESVKDNAIIIQKPALDGKIMVMVLAPNPKNANEQSASAQPAAAQSAEAVRK